MAERAPRIVVGVGSTDELDPVLPCALQIARGAGLEVHVVYAVDISGPVRVAHERSGCTDDLTGSEPEWCAQLCREQIEEQARRFGEGVRVHGHVLLGAPHERLTRVAREVDAEMLVVGANRRGRLLPHVVGPNAERVLRSSATPTLVVHAPFYHGVRRVLVATDLSDSAANVFEEGVATARALAAGEVETRAVYVVEKPSRLPPSLREAEIRDAAEGQLARFLGRRSNAVPADHAAVRFGEPAREICAEATRINADLIVIGVRGRGWAVERRIGSVASAVVRLATHNVLVVPAEPLEDLLSLDRSGARRRVAGV